MRTVIALVLILAPIGCKSKAKQEPGPATDPGSTASVDKVQDIAKEPRTAMAAKLGFLELTIEVPASASRPLVNKDLATWMFKDSKLAMRVQERSTPPSDDKLPGTKPPPTVDSKVTRKVVTEPGSWLVVDRADDAKRFEVEYCKDLDPAEPPSGVCCDVGYASEQPIVDLDKLIDFGTAMCKTLDVKNRKTVLPAR